MEITKLHELFLKSSGICTDSRKLKEKNLFFALKGDNFNGNNFALQAIEQGAIAAVIDEKPAEKNKDLIFVPSALKTLQELANYHRNFLKLPILAITGSNGKTTTKELISAVLSTEYKTVATTGNLNNHIGVPLTLLSMNENTELGIVEMGANHGGEIDFLCRIAEPDFGFITNFGKAHLEGFGSLEGVIAAKSELYNHLKRNKKLLFLNFDDPVQKQQLPYSKKFSFGEAQGADVKITYLDGSTFAEIIVEDTKVASHLIGNYNARNMAAACAIGTYFKVPSFKIKNAIEAYIPANNRSQILEKNTNKIILDAYNANPTSMISALENFTAMAGAKKTVILGDMFEVGKESAREHQNIVSWLESSPVDPVYLIGEHFYKTTSEEKIKKYKTFEDFKNEFKSADFKNTLILIKGSRGMALERVLELF